MNEETADVRKNLLEWLKIFLLNDCHSNFCEFLFAAKMYEMLIREEDED